MGMDRPEEPVGASFGLQGRIGFQPEEIQEPAAFRRLLDGRLADLKRQLLALYEERCVIPAPEEDKG